LLPTGEFGLLNSLPKFVCGAVFVTGGLTVLTDGCDEKDGADGLVNDGVDDRKLGVEKDGLLKLGAVDANAILTGEISIVVAARIAKNRLARFICCLPF